MYIAMFIDLYGKILRQPVSRDQRSGSSITRAQNKDGGEYWL